MIGKMKKFIVVTILGLTMMAPGIVPGLVAVAAADNITTGLCAGTNTATGGTTTSCTNTSGNGSLQAIATKAVNIFSMIVGAIAVVMVIYGGFKYITSGGESGNVSSAKNTLIYAIVGLLIVALAQFIVHFVLSTASSTGLN